MANILNNAGDFIPCINKDKTYYDSLNVSLNA